MTRLSDLSPEDRGLLTGLMYRVGIWMSQADDEEGELDDRREMEALNHILVHIAKHYDSPFVQALAQATIEHKARWPEWKAHSFDILADCEKAAAVLNRLDDALARKAYKDSLIRIAETVAGAFGEFGMGAADTESNALTRVLSKITARFGGEGDEADFMNISPAEHESLDRLQVALKLDDEDDIA